MRKQSPATTKSASNFTATTKRSTYVKENKVQNSGSYRPNDQPTQIDGCLPMGNCRGGRGRPDPFNCMAAGAKVRLAVSNSRRRDDGGELSLLSPDSPRQHEHHDLGHFHFSGAAAVRRSRWNLAGRGGRTFF